MKVVERLLETRKKTEKVGREKEDNETAVTEVHHMHVQPCQNKTSVHYFKTQKHNMQDNLLSNPHSVSCHCIGHSWNPLELSSWNTVILTGND